MTPEEQMQFKKMEERIKELEYLIHKDNFAGEQIFSKKITLKDEFVHQGVKAGFFNVSPAAQGSHIISPAGGDTQDAQSRAAINSVLTILENLGFTKKS